MNYMLHLTGVFIVLVIFLDICNKRCHNNNVINSHLPITWCIQYVHSRQDCIVHYFSHFK